MEFEKQVEDELIQLGYPIFYRNLNLIYNMEQFAEFDIVSTNFIVEVKSSKFNNSKNKGFNLFYRHNLLPKNFIYFIYSPVSSDEEIQDIKKMYTNPNYIFINNLKQIKNVIKPYKNISITNENNLYKFLKLPLCNLQIFDTIYIEYDVYKKIYEKLSDNHNSCLDNKRLWNLCQLMKQNKLCFNTSYSNYTYTMETKSNIITNIKMSSFAQLNLNLCYNMYNIRKFCKKLYSLNSPTKTNTE